jgi:hypothetical protein
MTIGFPMALTNQGWERTCSSITSGMLKPRHDLRYTRVHFSRPYPVRTNSNSTNCCVEKDLCACRRRV